MEVALACHLDPEVVLGWGDRTWDDVSLILRARAANSAAASRRVK